MAEKTEQATPKKLNDARKKGQVARSQDLPSVATFFVGFGLFLGLYDFFIEHLSAFIITCFKAAPDTNVRYQIGGHFNNGLIVMLQVSLPLLGAVVATGMFINFLLIGPLFTLEVFKPDPNRFNPVENLKQKFRMKTLVEILKSVIKIFVSALILYWIIQTNVPVITSTVALPLVATAEVLKELLHSTMVKVGIFFVVVGIADFIYQKMSFAKQMMMEKHEVKQEYKNSEGDPMIKGKRKQIAQEIAFSDGPANTRKAKAVVTNPTHIAVAIAYAPEEGIVAPYIVAMGEGWMAQAIIKEARKHEIPVLQNIYLARRLYSEGELEQFVPEDTYEAIAEILKWIASLKEEQDRF